MRVTAKTMLAAAVVVALACGMLPSAANARVRFDVDGSSKPQSVETIEVDGAVYFSLADVAELAGAARHWNPRNNKVSLSSDRHRVSLSAGNQFALLDTDIVNLVRPVVESDGAFWVPPEFVWTVLAEMMEADIEWTPASEIATVRGRGVEITGARLEERDDGTTLIIETSGLADVVTRSRNAGSVNLYVPGAALRDTIDIADGVGLVTRFEATADEGGVSSVVYVSPGAGTYAAFVRNDPPRVELTISAVSTSEIPSAKLRGAKQLRPRREDILGGSTGDIETVMIDPGHGGTDRGGSGPSGLTEKDATLAVARELARRLQRAGFYVFMTRSSDSYVPLSRRSEIANLAAADLFVSIHCDASQSRAASGHTVCYYRRSAAPPSRVSMRPGGGMEPASRDDGGQASELEWSSVQADLLDESRALARSIHGSMSETLSTHDRGISGRTLATLAGCAMPAVHVEVGFLSNRDEERRLDDAQYVDDVARAIARGVTEYRNESTGRRQ